MNAAEKYIKYALETAAEVAEKQLGNIEKASQLCADALLCGGMLFAFGTGHSHLLAEEIFYRAGGLARVYPILEDAYMLHRSAARSSELERAPGIADIILDDIDAVKLGGVMFIFSNSGRNTAPVDMALAAAKRGLKTVCITNMRHSLSVSSRHASGKKLYEVCDVAIDNKGIPGDAAIETGGHISGAMSTVTGAMIMQAITCRTIEIAAERGGEVEVFKSANEDGGDEYNSRIIAKYKGVIKPL